MAPSSNRSSRNSSLQPHWTELGHVSTPRPITIARGVPSAGCFIHQHLLRIYQDWGIIKQWLQELKFGFCKNTLREIEWAFPKWLRLVRTTHTLSMPAEVGCAFFTCAYWVEVGIPAQCWCSARKWKREWILDWQPTVPILLLFLKRFI